MHFFQRTTKTINRTSLASLRALASLRETLSGLRKQWFAQRRQDPQRRRVSPPELTILIVSYHQAGAK
jgi:hypothetical protein